MDCPACGPRLAMADGPGSRRRWRLGTGLVCRAANCGPDLIYFSFRVASSRVNEADAYGALRLFKTSRPDDLKLAFIGLEHSPIARADVLVAFAGICEIRISATQLHRQQTAAPSVFPELLRRGRRQDCISQYGHQSFRHSRSCKACSKQGHFRSDSFPTIVGRALNRLAAGCRSFERRSLD